MKRSLEQNDCLHKWCEVIAEHCNADRKEKMAYWAGRNKAQDMTPKEAGEAMYWLGDSRANSKDTIKEIVKVKFGPRVHVTAGIEQMEIVKPSHKWNTEECTEVLSLVDAWAATDLGLSLEREG